jgi:hypothetical protein
MSQRGLEQFGAYQKARELFDLDEALVVAGRNRKTDTVN